MLRGNLKNEHGQARLCTLEGGHESKTNDSEEPEALIFDSVARAWQQALVRLPVAACSPRLSAHQGVCRRRPRSPPPPRGRPDAASRGRKNTQPPQPGAQHSHHIRGLNTPPPHPGAQHRHHIRGLNTATTSGGSAHSHQIRGLNTATTTRGS